MKVVGLDLSLSQTGIVLINTDDIEAVFHDYKSWVVCGQKNADATTEERIARLVFMSDKIAAIVAECFLDANGSDKVVGIEGQSWSRRGRIGSLGELHGAVYTKLALFLPSKTLEITPVTSIRKTVLGVGRGKLSKVEVKKTLKRCFKLTFPNDDIMDAWMVAVATGAKRCPGFLPKLYNKAEAIL